MDRASIGRGFAPVSDMRRREGAAVERRRAGAPPPGPAPDAGRGARCSPFTAASRAHEGVLGGMRPRPCAACASETRFCRSRVPPRPVPIGMADRIRRMPELTDARPPSSVGRSPESTDGGTLLIGLSGAPPSSKESALSVSASSSATARSASPSACSTSRTRSSASRTLALFARGASSEEPVASLSDMASGRAGAGALLRGRARRRGRRGSGRRGPAGQRGC